MAKAEETTTERTAPGDAAPETVDVVLRRKEFLARVAAGTDLRPNQIKPVMERVLDELGKALVAGESLNLPPLGRLSVNRTRAGDKADIAVVKLRRPRQVADRAQAPLAEGAE